MRARVPALGTVFPFLTFSFSNPTAMRTNLRAGVQPPPPPRVDPSMTTTASPSIPTSLRPGSRRAAVDRAALVGFAIGVGAIVTIGLWFRHGGVAPATGPGAVATATGQVTALVGTYAILVQILFMSRIAWLERAVGLDHLAVWHRWLGFATVWLVTGPRRVSDRRVAAGDQVSPGAQTRDFVSHYPDVHDGLVPAVPRGRRRIGARGPPKVATGDVVLHPPLRVPRGRSRSRTSSRSAATSTTIGRHASGGYRLYLFVSVRSSWWRASWPTLNVRHRLRVHSVATRRRASCRSTSPDAARPHRRRTGPVLPLALRHPGHVVEDASVLALGGAVAGADAHHRQGSR